LIVNALRYGSPPVVVRGALGRGFRLVIEDSGNGVDPELVPRLFDRFTRGDQHRRSGVSGAGLGLAIASSFASALGGELAYETGRRSGARFVFRLPVGNR
jgi:signal transduction histidine kinase